MEMRKIPKQYSLFEYYTALVKGSRSIGNLRRNRKNEIISQEFVERLMLAVTEVNGCSVCAYGHTQMALSQGFTQAEITSFLSGNNEYILPEEAKAILFAQHYADTKGKVDRTAYNEILLTYGEKRTDVIIAAIQMMMIGNIAGLPISAFQRRIRGNQDVGSHLLHELGIPLSTLIILWPAIIQGVLERIQNIPGLTFLSYRK